MPRRLVAVVIDAEGRRELDLVRALYDRETVDRLPPIVPLVEPFEEGTPLADLADAIALVTGAQAPYLLELAMLERAFDGEQQVLQMVAAQGAAESQRLADALYREVLPHQRPRDPAGTPLARTTLTIGRFHSEREADRALAELQGRRYYLVAAQVGILEHQEDQGWEVVRTLDLGALWGPDAE
jgi:hypothetical protein